jgi:transcriptional regulator with GAF, ATPase, and Fis domain
MAQVLDLVRRVAPTDATVLIHGESGSGKEVIAKAIHHASPRARGSFVAINCAALPETLLESELFGHVKGAFTGAATNKKGLFEEAHGGTLLLDEIGEMPPSLQAKLLRTLQSGEIRPVGSTHAITIDARVLAATNRDLAQMIRQGGFREDLFYRLNVIPVTLPPLRERREDIPLLAEHFLARFAERQNRVLRLSPATMERLLRYPWPGNVRELENAMERGAILAQADTIEPDDLPPHVTASLTLGPRAEPRVASDPGRDRADPHHPNARALGREPFSSGRGSRDRANDPLAQAEGVRDRQVAAPKWTT